MYIATVNQSDMMQLLDSFSDLKQPFGAVT